MDKQQFTYILAIVDTVAVIIGGFWLGYLVAVFPGNCAAGQAAAEAAGGSIQWIGDRDIDPCLEVYGKVRGDLLPGSKVYLFQTNGSGYFNVMAAVQRGRPLDWTWADKEQRFDFGCLESGDYAVAVPGFSYNASIGYPLPLQLQFRNLDLKIAFQGGDKNYAAGASSIKESPIGEPARTEELCFPLPAAYQ